MLRLDQVDELHALIEQRRVRYSPALGQKFAYIGLDYAVPVSPRPRDPIRDMLFPKRKPGWLLRELQEDWWEAICTKAMGDFSMEADLFDLSQDEPDAWIHFAIDIDRQFAPKESA